MWNTFSLSPSKKQSLSRTHSLLNHHTYAHMHLSNWFENTIWDTFCFYSPKTQSLSRTHSLLIRTYIYQTNSRTQYGTHSFFIPLENTLSFDTRIDLPNWLNHTTSPTVTTAAPENVCERWRERGREGKRGTERGREGERERKRGRECVCQQQQRL